MKRLTIATGMIAALVLFCSRPAAVRAQGNTKIIIKDGGSILLHADGLGGSGWNASWFKTQYTHKNTAGTLAGVQVVDGGQNRCTNATCGIDTSMPWSIVIQYDSGKVMRVESHKANKGIHIRDSSFHKWSGEGTDDRT